MSQETRRQLVRLIFGGAVGAVLAPTVVYVMWGSFLMEGAGRPVALPGTVFPVVLPEMAQQFGSLLAAILVQSLLGAVLGGVVALSTMPFADEGKPLVVNSLLHFATTATAFSLLFGVCRWVPWNVLPVYLFLMTILYVLIWLGRWVGWYLEVMQLRALLGLDPGPTPLKWRETMPYLPFLLLVCDGFPLLLRLMERFIFLDNKYFTLSGFLYPCLLLPVVCFVSGLSLGKRQGVCPLYPVACFLCCRLMVSLLVDGTVLFHGFLAVVPALAGNVLGWMYRRAIPKKRGKSGE